MAKTLLFFDFGIQAILLSIILAFGIFYLPLLLLIPLGGWQLGSALIKGIAWRSRLYFTYFLAASAYCLALYAFVDGLIELPELEGYWHSTASWAFFFLFIPITGAITYCMWCYKDLSGQKPRYV